MTLSLAGRRIVVTRPASQSSRLVAALRERGAEVLEVPSLETAPPEDTEPLDEALRALERYDWIAFTSANAVRAMRDRLAAGGLPTGLRVRGPRIACVGPSTRGALEAAFPGDPVDLEPERDFRAAGLLEAFRRLGATGLRVLLPASTRARDELSSGLRGLGALVDVRAAYRTIEPPGLTDAVTRCLAEGFDAVAFASPSSVEGFASAAGPRARGLEAVVIGPTTEAAARAAGLRVRAVADPSTDEGLVRALETWLGRAGP